MPQISVNSDKVTPAGAPNIGGGKLNNDFRLISCYISETVQDSDIVTVEG